MSRVTFSTPAAERFCELGWSRRPSLVENLAMGAELPEIEREGFGEDLIELSGRELSSEVLNRLWIHYQELRRWNRVVSLVGPGTVTEVLDRHYAESLAGLSLIGAEGSGLVDIGSGAGFPALILAAAQRQIQATLIESSERKWSFLKAVSRKMALPCVCLNARVGTAPVESLPPRIDILTSRAVSESDLGLDALLPRLSRRGFVLLWAGERTPKIPESFTLMQELPLARSRTRRILKIGRS